MSCIEFLLSRFLIATSSLWVVRHNIFVQSKDEIDNMWKEQCKAEKCQPFFFKLLDLPSLQNTLLRASGKKDVFISQNKVFDILIYSIILL